MDSGKERFVIIGLALFLTVLFIGYLGPVITGNVVKENSAVSLADFPYPFIKNGVLNQVVVVVPDAPSPDELLAAHDIALLFDDLLGVRPEVQTVSAAGSDVANRILVGNVCARVVQEIMPDACGTVHAGVLRLVNGQDAVHLVVTGGSGDDVRVAAKALVLYRKYLLQGQDVRVQGDLAHPFGFVIS